MASTNKTKNFKLSQFVQTDKPTFLGDYNSDMNKIDDALETVKNGYANTDVKIGDLTKLKTENKLDLVDAINEIDAKEKTLDTNVTENTNSINDVDTKIGNLSSLETTDKSNVVNAINEASSTARIALNTLNNRTGWQINDKVYTENDITIKSGSGTIDSAKIYLNFTGDYKMYSLSGYVLFSNIVPDTTNGFEIQLNNTGLLNNNDNYFTIGTLDKDGQFVGSANIKIERNVILIDIPTSQTSELSLNISDAVHRV